MQCLLLILLLPHADDPQECLPAPVGIRHGLIQGRPAQFQHALLIGSATEFPACLLQGVPVGGWELGPSNQVAHAHFTVIGLQAFAQQVGLDSLHLLARHHVRQVREGGGLPEKHKVIISMDTGTGTATDDHAHVGPRS